MLLANCCKQQCVAQHNIHTGNTQAHHITSQKTTLHHESTLLLATVAGNNVALCMEAVRVVLTGNVLIMDRTSSVGVSGSREHLVDISSLSDTDVDDER